MRRPPSPSTRMQDQRAVARTGAGVGLAVAVEVPGCEHVGVAAPAVGDLHCGLELRETVGRRVPEGTRAVDADHVAMAVTVEVAGTCTCVNRPSRCRDADEAFQPPLPAAPELQRSRRGRGQHPGPAVEPAECCAVGRAEPGRVEVPEVAVAVGGAGVAGAGEVRESRGVGLVRGVRVEGGRGVVLHVDRGAAAAGLRAPQDGLHARLLAEAILLVGDQLARALVELNGETGRARRASARVGAGPAHRVGERTIGRRLLGDEALLLLERGQDHLRADAAGDLDAVDPGGDRHACHR